MVMPLEQLANIAEIFGMLIVAITLIYLTVQMRQNIRATRSATANDSVSMVSAWYTEIGNSEQSSALFYNAMADPEARTPEEWVQFVMLVHGIFLAFQNSYYLAREGTLDDRITQTINVAIVGIKNQPGFQLYWRQRKAIFYPEFQDYVETVMSSDHRVSEGIYKDINSA
jgi:hypothetical protein